MAATYLSVAQYQNRYAVMLDDEEVLVCPDVSGWVCIEDEEELATFSTPTEAVLWAKDYLLTKYKENIE